MANGPAQRRPAPGAPHRGLGDPRLDQFGRLAHQTKETLRAFGSGAVDAVSMGAADPIIAGARAFFTGPPGSWTGRYKANMAAERARDDLDRRKYAIARGGGQVAGTLGAVLGAEAILPFRVISAGAGGVYRAGRILNGLGHSARVGGALGAVSGLGGQMASDIADSRLSSARKYLGSALGGTVAGITAPYVGPTRAGAVEGAATPAIQALLDARIPSIDEMSSGAVGGGALGRLGGELGARWSHGLSKTAKGELGEFLARLDTRLRAERVTAQQERVALPGSTPKRGYLVADQITEGLFGPGRTVEAKFGFGARLSKNQKIAKKLGNLDVVHFNPGDVGNITGVGAATGGAPIFVRDAHERVRGGGDDNPSIPGLSSYWAFSR